MTVVTLGPEDHYSIFEGITWTRTFWHVERGAFMLFTSRTAWLVKHTGHGPYSPLHSESNQTQGKTSESSTRIREQLKALRSDEVASIAQNVVRQGTILQQEIAWFRHNVIGNTVSLVVYMARTWVNVFVGYVEKYAPLPIGTNSSSLWIDA